ncbi:HAMP domain-containing sensor histidine kinase [Paenibacillus graminis]|uniref:sensor histidine kinase n=1 Tax=Paenibacillus graminis TaxID=189425 RepID=UPI002DB7645B|nr:HAMP domain-containing sensor histidine kinase [Paenibacillus graminis]MEC0167195.1 HAMP domain-containing sensor histidine kinase [Paenibacillus graminis]
MTSSKYVLSSKRCSLIFSVIFLLLVLGYAGIAAFLEGGHPALMELTVLFVSCMLLLGGVWNWTLRRQITRFMDSVDEMVDRAIHGREKMTHFDETSLSSLEHKLWRYIEINKANEQNLETEKNTIKELISDISHQTKTPLSNIILYSQLLAETPELGGNTRLLLNQIESQSEKLEWLITSLVKLSRLETGMITLQSTVSPVIETITRAVSHIYTRAENKGIDIQIQCDRLTKARHDHKWTSEALFNLLENAVKYTEAGGSIKISAESNEMFTRIDVSDTGIGIQREELEHIFKRFYRGCSARDYEGIGIGLFLTQKIISIQGGFITAASEVGKGTKLALFLPQI